MAVVPDEPLEKFHPGSNAVACVSAAVCQAGAVSAKKPLYRHIATLMHGKVRLLIGVCIFAIYFAISFAIS